MKKRLAILFFIIGIIPQSYCQEKYIPRVIVLSPENISVAPELEREMAIENGLLKTNSSFMLEFMNQHDNDKELSLNMKASFKSTMIFFQFPDISKFPSSYTQVMLIDYYRKQRQDALVISKDVKSNENKSELKKIGEDEGIDYIVNIPFVSYYKKANVAFARIVVQLYSTYSDSFFFSKEYVTKDIKAENNDCPDSSISCHINSALLNVEADIADAIKRNNPLLIKDEKLRKERSSILLKNYYSIPCNSEFVKESVVNNSFNDNIHLNALYRCITDEAKEKFVAFFIEDADSNKNLPRKYPDDEPEIRDFKYVGYVVSGVKYNNKWYSELHDTWKYADAPLDSIKTDFFTRMLDKNFFKTNSVELNPSFWEAGMFRRVTDLKNDSSFMKENKGTFWEKYILEERQYLGLFQVVADVLMQENEKRNSNYEEDMNYYGISFFSKLVESDPVNFEKYELHLDPQVIHSDKRDMVICPVMITDSKNRITLQYFVFIPAAKTNYKWTYFPPTTLTDKEDFNSDLIETQFRPLTEWNPVYSTINDDAFWNKYVLLRSGGKYVYLEEIK